MCRKQKGMHCGIIFSLVCKFDAQLSCIAFYTHNFFFFRLYRDTVYEQCKNIVRIYVLHFVAAAAAAHTIFFVIDEKMRVISKNENWASSKCLTERKKKVLTFLHATFELICRKFTSGIMWIATISLKWQSEKLSKLSNLETNWATEIVSSQFLKKKKKKKSAIMPAYGVLGLNESFFYRCNSLRFIESSVKSSQ